MIEPAMHKLEEEFKDRVDVWKVNADEQPQVLQALNIQGIPTLVAFNRGKEVARHVGAGSPARLRAPFEAALSGDPQVAKLPLRIDNSVRIAGGVALLCMAYLLRFNAWGILLTLVGWLVLISVVINHCPVYRGLSRRLVKTFSGGQTGEDLEE
jgi:hypothetical protein